MTLHPLRVISYGGGVQSTALIVLAATRNRDFERVMGGRVVHALFSNVGDDSEHPATLAFVRDVATPWASERGVDIVELRRVNRRRGPETLWQELMRPESRSIPIPMRMPDTGAPGTRNCTDTYKSKVISRWLRVEGATANAPATVAIGISVDEIERAGRRSNDPHEHRVYPLLDLGLSRNDCANVIREAGLPVPPKSSCYFCPFHRPQTWAEMRRDEPDLFDKAQQLEDVLNERRDALGKDHVYLTRFGKRLSDAIQPAQDGLFDADDYTSISEAGCDEGVCFV